MRSKRCHRALPELIGGSADLAGSNLTLWSGSKAVSKASGGGNYIYYGVREFGMSAIMNGVTLHGGLIPFGATFLTFSDYSRNALRMAALMKIRTLFVFTHDSIGLAKTVPRTSRSSMRQLAPDPEHGRLAPLRFGGICGGLDCRDRAPGRSRRVCCSPARICHSRRAHGRKH
jgi:hypothetical protein